MVVDGIDPSVTIESGVTTVSEHPDLTTPGRPAPAHLIIEPVGVDHLGILRSGKEAQVDLVSYVDDTGATCLVARKRYLPRTVTAKGQLESLGVQRASTFRHDVGYREGRQFRKSRDRRAVEGMTTHGRRLLQDRWLHHEYDVMASLWEAGVLVPYPLSYDSGDEGDRFDMEFVGTEIEAAPRLAEARLHGAALGDAWGQVRDGLARMVGAGWAHGDLSAYNLLWWDDAVWFIDFPQAVDIAANPQGVDFLHRDVGNIAEWFIRRGLEVDAEEVFAELLGHWR